MPRLPLLSGVQIVARLEEMGFAKVRQLGSHVVMRKGSSGTVVRIHREVKVGTLAGILRQAGLTAEDFLG